MRVRALGRREFAGVLSLLLWPGAVTLAIAKTPGEVEIGQILGDATLLGLNGPSRTLSEFRGRPLIINVWAGWCGVRAGRRWHRSRDWPGKNTPCRSL